MVTLALCLLMGPWFTNQIVPPTAETWVSDARGFGAVKLLLDQRSTTYEELRLDEKKIEQLRELREWSVKRYGETHEQLRKRDIPSRQVVTSVIDKPIEEQITAILGAELFRQFSRFVVRQRSSENPFAVFSSPGTIEYVAPDNRDEYNLFSLKVQSILSGESRFEIVVAELNSLVKKLDGEQQSKFKLIFGNVVQIQTTQSKVLPPPPERKSNLTEGNLRFAVSDQGFKEILHNDESARESLQELLGQIEKEVQSRLYPVLFNQKLDELEKKKQSDALMRDFASRSQAVSLRVMNAKQLSSFYEFVNRSKLNEDGFRTFFQDYEFGQYLSIGQEELMKLADVADKSVSAKREIAIREALRRFLPSLDRGARERIDNLIDLSSLEIPK